MPDINTIKRVDSFSLYGKLIEQFGHEDNYKNTILTHVSEDNVSYMTFSPFTESDIVKQVFSTRLGGVSKGMYESMNLTFNPVGEYEATLKEWQQYWIFHWREWCIQSRLILLI